VSSAKIAISLDPRDLRQVDRLVRSGRFPSRSKLLQDALHEKLQRLDRSRLAEECSKLISAEEQAFANEHLRADAAWPEY
jgi:Arc/MetJ-type ribon-helix-helix transcriptional regulator